MYSLGVLVETRNYWLTIFSVTTWQEFLDHGARVAGYSEIRWTTVQRIKQGDYLICYLTQVSRWIAVLEVISDPYLDQTTIWKGRAFPCRVAVKTIASLTVETGIPALDIKDKLSVFQKLNRPQSWGALFKTSPHQWSNSDGEVVLNAILKAKADWTEQPSVSTQ